jgi:3-oxoisoapionate decarboxylase
MLLGLDTNSYRMATGLYEFRPTRPIGLHALLRKANVLGLAGVHIANSQLLESFDHEYLLDIRQEAESCGLYLEYGAHGTDVAQLREAIDVAAALGSQVVRTFVGADRQQGWAAWRQQLDRAVEALKQVAPAARNRGISIAIENHGDLTSPELVSLLDKVRSDDVGVCLDTGKSLLVIEDPLLATQNLAPYVITACLTDYQLVSTARGMMVVGCALGQGVVDLMSIVQLLRQRRPDLRLNVESPVVRWELPLLEDKYWDSFYDRSPKDLVAILRLIRRNALDPAANYLTPAEQGLPEDVVLAHEQNMVERSVRYCNEFLLRP